MKFNFARQKKKQIDIVNRCFNLICEFVKSYEIHISSFENIDPFDWQKQFSVIGAEFLMILRLRVHNA